MEMPPLGSSFLTWTGRTIPSKMDLLSTAFVFVVVILLVLILLVLILSAFLPRQKRKELRDYLLRRWIRLV
jgi:hypothetical protein